MLGTSADGWDDYFGGTPGNGYGMASESLDFKMFRVWFIVFVEPFKLV